MILDYYLIIGMKKEIINNQQQYHHNHHSNHTTMQSIHIGNTGNAGTRLNFKTAGTGAGVQAPVSTTKNVRSSSLPLKIVGKNNHLLLSNQTSANNNNSHVRSWTDFSFLNKQRNTFDCFNMNGLYFNYKYRQLSRSERFLDFMEFREQPTDEQLNFNSNSSISSLSSFSPSNSCTDSCSVSSNKFKNNHQHRHIHNKLEEEDEYDYRADSDSSSSSSSSTSSSPNNEHISSNIVESSSNLITSPTSSSKSDQIETAFSHSRTFNTNESSTTTITTATTTEAIVQTIKSYEPETNEINLHKCPETGIANQLPVVVADETACQKYVPEVKTNGNF